MIMVIMGAPPSDSDCLAGSSVVIITSGEVDPMTMSSDWKIVI